MKRVTIGGVSYHLPFADLLRALGADELAALKQSVIGRGGVHGPGAVVTATIGGVGRAVIDGAHRAAVCQAEGLACATRDMGEVTADVARGWALDLNVARRHLSPGELEQKRRERVVRVAAKREENKSLRTIAAEEGVSLGQVQRDLAGVSGDTPDEPSEHHVVGADGKTYRQPPKVVPKPPTPAEEALCAAHRHARALAAAVGVVLAGAGGDRLREAAAEWGVPIPAGQESWPAVTAVAGAVADAGRG